MASSLAAASLALPATRRPAAFVAAPPARRLGAPRPLSTPALTVPHAVSTDQDIEGLSRDYCDEFVCTSSPAIESTVRALSRDLTRANGVWTRSLLSRNVEYKGFARFNGPDGFARLNFIPKTVTSPRIQVLRLRMVDDSPGTAEITWKLQGALGPTALAVDADMTTRIEMNLLTGQIEQRTDSWDLSRCSALTKAAFWVAVAAFAAGVGGAAAAESTNSMLDSLASMDQGDGGQFTEDPTDPNKFFQQKDNFKEDAALFVGAVVFLYFLTQAGSTLLK